MKTFIARSGNGLVVAALGASALLATSGEVRAQNLTVAGTVGVGTTSPTAKLEINKGTTVGGGVKISGTNDTRINIGAGQPTSWSWANGWANPGDFSLIQEGVSGSVIYVKPGGNLGIATQSPATRLDVNGDVSVGGVNIIRRDGTNAHLFPWGTGYAGNNVYFGAGVGGIPLFASAFNQFSSARYKKNISDSTYGLEEVLRLRVKRYQYKGSEKPEIGLIAEEVVKVIPEIVALDKQGRPDAIDYSKLSPILLQGLQDLERENERLSASNEQLARRISRLEAQRTSQTLRSSPVYVTRKGETK